MLGREQSPEQSSKPHGHWVSNELAWREHFTRVVITLLGELNVSCGVPLAEDPWSTCLSRPHPPISLSQGWSYSASFHCSNSFLWDWFCVESCESSPCVTEPGVVSQASTAVLHAHLPSWWPSSLGNAALCLLIPLTMKPTSSDVSTAQHSHWAYVAYLFSILLPSHVQFLSFCLKRALTPIIGSETVTSNM